MSIPFSIALITSSVLASAPSLESKLAPIVARAGMEAGSFGIGVYDLATGEPLFERNAQKGLNPASSLKLLVAATSLKTLGPDFRFETLLLKHGKDICLKGGGDPSLVNETMWNLVEEVRRKGIDRIDGNFLADESFYPSERKAIEAFQGDSDRAFTAPISALTVNFNALTIHAEPAALGELARVFPDPPLPVFRVTNRAVTAATATKSDLGASVTEKKGLFDVQVWGKVSKATERTTIYRSVAAPPLYAAHLFLEHFRRSGGKFGGEVRAGPCSPGATVVVTFRSKPLSQIVFDMNKFSNNIIAEMLLRAVAKWGPSEAGLEEIRKWLASSKISAPELVIENASGLSRKTRVSANTLASVVRAAANDLSIGPEFLASIPIAGTDGTLHRRMVGTPMASRVRGKSGMLSGIVSLTGAAQRSNGGKAAFAFLFNDSSGKEGARMTLEEQMLQAIVGDERGD